MQEWIAATAPVKKLPKMIELMVQVASLQEASKIKTTASGVLKKELMFSQKLGASNRSSFRKKTLPQKNN